MHWREVPVEKILPSGPLSIGSADPTILMDGWCQQHGGSRPWLGLCLSCPFKDISPLSLCKDKPCSRLGMPFKVASLQLQKEGWQNATYPSVCWRVCLIVLICWKCPDISVDKTISITRLRSSLWAIKVITMALILYWGTWIVLHWFIWFLKAKTTSELKLLETMNYDLQFCANQL